MTEAEGGNRPKTKPQVPEAEGGDRPKTKPQVPEAEGGNRPSPSSPAIELEGLVREYDDRPVLDGVDASVPQGLTLAVLGPNGAGKTTLLRILAGLLRPTAGTVRVLGSELPRERRSVRSRIGWLGHEPLLYRDLTALENLRLESRLRGLGDAGSERARELLARTGIERFAHQLVRTLSAGTLQRLSVCQALMGEPELLLLDEATAHLDPQAREVVEPMLAAGGGRTRVLVSHEPERALAGADLVLALGGDGVPAYHGPAAAFDGERAAALYG